MEKVKSLRGIVKINLNVENVGGFAVKNMKTRGKKWSKFS